MLLRTGTKVLFRNEVGIHAFKLHLLRWLVGHILYFCLKCIPKTSATCIHAWVTLPCSPRLKCNILFTGMLYCTITLAFSVSGLSPFNSVSRRKSCLEIIVSEFLIAFFSEWKQDEIGPASHADKCFKSYGK